MLVNFAHRTPGLSYKNNPRLSSFSLSPQGAPFLLPNFDLPFFLQWQKTERKPPMESVISELIIILMAGMLAALLGFSMLLCAMILDDRHDAAARAVALRGSGARVVALRGSGALAT